MTIQRAIQGVVKVSQVYHQDPTDPTGDWGMVNVVAVAPLKRKVTLADIKAEPKLAHLPLVRQPRLSVQKIDVESFRLLCKLGDVDYENDL